MRYRSTFLPIALLLVVLPAALASGNTWRAPDAFNPVGVPFQLLQVPSTRANSVVGQDGLSIRYAILNTSKDSLTQVGIEVLTFFPSGQAKGFHIFTLKTRIAPGEQAFGTYASAQYHVAAHDRLVIVPYSASGPALRWVMNKDDLTAVNQALDSAQGDVSSAGMLTLQERSAAPPHSQYPGDPGGSGNCLSTCQSVAAQCEALCKCGVSSSGCTCNPDGSLTTNCSCFQCPKPPGS